MKYIYLLLILFILLLSGENNYGEDIKKVNAKSGLNIRSLPSRTALKVGFLPNNSIVKIIEYSSNIDTVEDITTNWAKVEFNDTIGWVFSGFLCDVDNSNIPENTNLSINDYNSFYEVNMGVYYFGKKKKGGIYEYAFAFPGIIPLTLSSLKHNS